MSLLREKNNKILMFTILLILCCVQSISIIEVEGAVLKPSHLFSLLFLPLLGSCIRLPNIYIFFFYGMLVISTILGASVFGVNSLVMNYLYGFYLLTTILTIGKDINYSEWISIFRKSAIVVIGLIIINDYLQKDAIIQFLNYPFGHPSIDYLFGGGANLEATWISLFLFTFNDSKLFLPYLVFCLGISAIYASRVGVMVIAIFVVIKIFSRKGNVNPLKMFSIFLLGIGIIVYMFYIGIFDYIISRFVAVGYDPGSLGRLAMWKFAGQAIIDNPFGVGIGNALNYLRETTGIQFYENNMHNLYMQMFVELGWIGGLYYAIVITVFAIRNRKNAIKNIFIGMLYTYILMSMLQFRGGEPIIFFILGVYLTMNGNDEKRYQQ